MYDPNHNSYKVSFKAALVEDLAKLAGTPPKTIMAFLVIGLLLGITATYIAITAVGDLARFDRSIRALDEAAQASQGDLRNLRGEVRENQRSLKAAADAIKESVDKLDSNQKDLKNRVEQLLSRTEQLEPKVERLTKDVGNLTLAQERVKTLETSLSEKQSANAKIQTQLTNTNRTLTNTVQELETKKKQLEVTLKDSETYKEQARSLSTKITAFEKTIGKLDKDRVMIVELRKDPPSTKDDADAFWRNMRRVAGESDSRLGLLVDNIISRIDSYFKWADAQPSPDKSIDEFFDWLVAYGSSGAADYDRAVQRFQREALLVVVTHIGLTVDLFP